MFGAILLSVSGCASSTATDSFCLIAQPIYGDPEKDTPETMQQIDEFNAVGMEVCGW